MADKSAEYARETLNALIAGGHFSKALLKVDEQGIPVLDSEMLSRVERLLIEHYTAPSEPLDYGKLVGR